MGLIRDWKSRSSEAGGHGGSAEMSRLLRIFLIVTIAWFPALAGRNAVRSVSALFPLADLPNPYFVPGHAGLLYAWAPLVAISTCLLFLSPGLYLTLALGAAKGIGEWVSRGYALSLLVVSAGAALVQAITGTPLRGAQFAAFVAGCSLVCFGLAVVRCWRRRPNSWPWEAPHAATTIASVVAVPLLLVVALTPKFYWESFTGDGDEALECARLLYRQILPFWPTSEGEIAAFPGFTTMLFIFPASWFVRLFGEFEASVRLPLLLHLMALYGAVLGVVDHGRARLAGLAERWLIWLGLAVYVVVMAFNATYDPYSADIAEPTAMHTPLIACFLGFVLSFLRAEQNWCFLWICLTYITAPTGLFLILLWVLAVSLLWKPRPWARAAAAAAMTLGLAVVLHFAPHVLTLLHSPVPGQQHSWAALANRLALLQWTDWHRILFLVVPGGILPAVALLAWRWQGQETRALSFVTIAYFGFFFIQAQTALHYFVPAMLLPMVVLWRSDIVSDPARRLPVLLAAGVTGLLALVISLPDNAAPRTAARVVGETIEDRTGGYEMARGGSFRRFSVLRHLTPRVWHPVVPDQCYGGSPRVWYHYAHRKDNPHRKMNYVLQRDTLPAPTGMRLLAAENQVALYVLSDAVLTSHRQMRPPHPAGSRLYEIPRGLLFRHQVPYEQSVVDMRPVLLWLRHKWPREDGSHAEGQDTALK